MLYFIINYYFIFKQFNIKKPINFMGIDLDINENKIAARSMTYASCLDTKSQFPTKHERIFSFDADFAGGVKF